MHKNINAIDQVSIHQITSGQVIVDLQTAVKELLENSMDAGANNIEVRFKQNGLKGVEVVDNGCGIAEGDHDSIALKHHTSKLENYSDLLTMSTFGFRGEALSSLCSLSEQVTVTTATSSTAPMGACLVMNSKGEVTKKSTVARQQGTTVSLANLFSSLPVRRKEFQRNVKREYGKALSLLTAYALGPCAAGSGVRLTVSNQPEKGTKTVPIQTQGTPTLRSSATSLWGSKALDQIVDMDVKFEVQREGSIVKRLQSQDNNPISVNVQGLVSKFAVGCGRTGTDRQFFYVNGRPCSMPTVQKAFNEVYRSFNANQAPLVVADFVLPTDAYDVNVSPDKRTILIHHEHNFVVALKTALESTFSSERSTYDVGSTECTRTQTVLTPSFARSGSKSSASALKPSCDLKADKPTVEDTEMVDELEDERPSGSGDNELLDLSRRRPRTTKGSPKSRPTARLPSPLVNFKSAAGSAANEGSSRLKSSAASIKSQSTLRSYANDTGGSTLRGPKSPASTTSRRSKNNGRRAHATVRPHVAPDDDAGPSGPSDGEKDIDEPISSPNQRREDAGSSEPSRGEKNVNDLTSSPNPTHDEIGLSEPSNGEKDVNDPTSSSPDPTHASLATTPPALSQNDQAVEPEVIKTDKHDWDVCLRLSLSKVKQVWSRTRGPVVASDAESGKEGVPLDAGVSNTEDNEKAALALSRVIEKTDFGAMAVVGQFNLGFIIVRRRNGGCDDLFIVDQHAADEKYNFETLQKTVKLESQKLFRPQHLELTASDEILALDNLPVLQQNGFEIHVEENVAQESRLKLVAIPVSKSTTFDVKDLEEIILLLRDHPAGHMVRCSKARAMFASRACRKSVMVGTTMTKQQMTTVINNMGIIDQPWNCPHGRPTMRHLSDITTSAVRAEKQISWASF